MNNRSLNLPPVAGKLLLAMVAIQLLRTVLPPDLSETVVIVLGLDLFPRGVFEPVQLYGLVTSIFVHASWWHLLANGLWVVVIAGQMHEHIPGRRFVWFFVATGALGALAHAAFNWGLPQILVGASGAVFGLLGGGAYVLIRGRDGHSKPAASDIVKYIVMMMVINLVYAFLSGGVSWEAHAGGFFAGLVLFPFMRKPLPPPGPRLVV